MKAKKKAFTLVELVVVIAVVAILAAVLIPTFASIIKQANENADTQLVRHLNTALAMDGKEHKTMQSALDAAEGSGFDVAKINAKVDTNEILWDSKNDVFCYLKGDVIEYVPNSVSAANALEAGDYRLWKISDTVTAEDTYSTYYTGDPVAISTSKGFDAGKVTGISSITYTNTGTAQNVVIRTNSASTNLSVNAPNDTVAHYDQVGNVEIYAVDPNHSYHENGNVKKIAIAEGHIVIAEDVKIPTLTTFTYTDENNVIKGGDVSIDNKGIISSMDTVVTNGNVTINNSGEIESAVTGTQTTVTGSEVENKTEITSTPTCYTSGALGSSGYYYLSNDVDLGNSNITVSADVVLNGNGYSISSTVSGAVIVVQSNFTIINTTINATNTAKTGRGIAIDKDDVKLTIDGCVINTTQRGITVNRDDNDSIELNVNSTVIQMTNGIKDYNTEVNGASDYNSSRGISLWEMGHSVVNINNSTIQGFYYSINLSYGVNNTSGLTMNIEESTLIGRAGINNYTSNSTFNIKDTRIKGINVYLGKNEDFANIVNNSSLNGTPVTNNTYNIEGCTFEIYRAPATGTNGQHVIDLRAAGNKVVFKGNNSVVADVYYNLTDELPTEKSEFGQTVILYKSTDIEGILTSTTLNLHKGPESKSYTWDIYAVRQSQE